MKDYTYAVARIRAKETELMTRQDIEQLISAADYNEAERLINEHGGGAGDGLWELLSDIADKALLDVLRLPVDYHNIKAAVKSVFSQTDAGELLLDNGTVDKNVVYECVRARDYSVLGAELGRTAEAAMTMLLRTQDGQLCDMLIDKAMLGAINRAAAGSGNSFLKRYTELKADTANLKTAMRCAVMGKGPGFTENALFEGGTLDYGELAKSASDGIEALERFVSKTSFAEGAELIKKSPAAFEKWCDDRVTELMDEAKYESFSAAPVLAYAHAKETERRAVQLILSAKQSRIDSDIIRERVRRLYV